MICSQKSNSPQNNRDSFKKVEPIARDCHANSDAPIIEVRALLRWHGRPRILASQRSGVVGHFAATKPVKHCEPQDADRALGLMFSKSPTPSKSSGWTSVTIMSRCGLV